MTLIKKFAAPLGVMAMVAVMALSLVAQTPRTASAAQAAGEPCRAAANTTSTILGNSGSTGAITSVNSGSTTTMRIHFDDLNAANTIRLRVGSGSVNGQAATAQDLFFTSIDAGAQLCGTSGLAQTGDGDAVLTAADDAYIQFSFAAPTLPSGIQSQLVKFEVDGNNDGDFTDVNDATYFLTVATAASSITVGAPDDANISATAANTDAGGAAIVATVRDASGTAIVGTTVDVVTTAGGLDQSGAAGTCDANNAAGTADTTAGNLSQACSATTDANGQVIPTLYGLGNGGTATVTFTVRGTSVQGTQTVIISALPATLEVSGRRTNSATSFVAKGVLRNTDSTTATEGADELFIAAVAKDASGNVVGSGNVTFTITGPAGNTVIFVAAAEQLTLTGTACSVSGANTTSCIDAIEAAAAGASTPSHAVAVIDIDNATTSPEPVGEYTVTATIAGNNATVTGTFKFMMVKAPASLSIADIGNVDLGGNKAVAITCKDADGNACPGGSIITVNVSNTNLIAQNASTGTTGTQVADLRTNDSGVATVTLIGVTPGTTNIVANVGTVTAVKPATVGTTQVTTPTTPTTPTTGGSTFSVAPVAGLTFTQFGGTIAQLSTASTAAGVKTVSATVGGKMLTFVVGAPDFVNAAFVAAFPSGIPANTIVVAAK